MNTSNPPRTPKTYTAAQLTPAIVSVMGFTKGCRGVANLTADARVGGTVAAVIGWTSAGFADWDEERIVADTVEPLGVVIPRVVEALLSA